MPMLDGLRAALDETGFKWALFGWSERPSEDYGVYAPSEQEQFRSDGDSGSEIMPQGTVDYFTHDFSRDPQIAIENALRSIGLSWKLEDIQFEPASGFIHYTWTWTDVILQSELCKITFILHDGRTVEQHIKKGETPTEPPRDGYTDDGLRYVRTKWDTEITAASGDAIYTAVYNIFGYLRPGNKVYNGIGEDENGLPTSFGPWNTTNIEEFRTRTRTQGERAKAIFWGGDYSDPYGLTIKASGYDGYFAYELMFGDVSFVVV